MADNASYYVGGASTPPFYKTKKVSARPSANGQSADQEGVLTSHAKLGARSKANPGKQPVSLSRNRDRERHGGAGASTSSTTHPSTTRDRHGRASLAAGFPRANTAPEMPLQRTMQREVAGLANAPSPPSFPSQKVSKTSPRATSPGRMPNWAAVGGVPQPRLSQPAPLSQPQLLRPFSPGRAEVYAVLPSGPAVAMQRSPSPGHARQVYEVPTPSRRAARSSSPVPPAGDVPSPVKRMGLSGGSLQLPFTEQVAGSVSLPLQPPRFTMPGSMELPVAQSAAPSAPGSLRLPSPGSCGSMRGGSPPPGSMLLPSRSSSAAGPARFAFGAPPAALVTRYQTPRSLPAQNPASYPVILTPAATPTKDVAVPETPQGGPQAPISTPSPMHGGAAASFAATAATPPPQVSFSYASVQPGSMQLGVQQQLQPFGAPQPQPQPQMVPHRPMSPQLQPPPASHVGAAPPPTTSRSLSQSLSASAPAAASVAMPLGLIAWQRPEVSPPRSGRGSRSPRRSVSPGPQAPPREPVASPRQGRRSASPPSASAAGPSSQGPAKVPKLPTWVFAPTVPAAASNSPRGQVSPEPQQRSTSPPSVSPRRTDRSTAPSATSASTGLSFARAQAAELLFGVDTTVNQDDQGFARGASGTSSAAFARGISGSSSARYGASTEETAASKHIQDLDNIVQQIRSEAAKRREAWKRCLELRSHLDAPPSAMPEMRSGSKSWMQTRPNGEISACDDESGEDTTLTNAAPHGSLAAAPNGLNEPVEDLQAPNFSLASVASAVAEAVTSEPAAQEVGVPRRSRKSRPEPEPRPRRPTRPTKPAAGDVT